MIRCEFINAVVPDPCPRKTVVLDDARSSCTACRDEITERAAIMEYQGKIPRALADSLAREAAIKSLPGQRNLIE